MQIILVLFFAITFFALTRNVLFLVFSLENYSIHKRRLKQLQFGNKKDREVTDLIDSITKPVITSIFPRLKIKNLEEIEKDLKYSGWEKYLDAKQFVALKIVTKILAFVVAFLVSFISKFLATLFFIVLFFSVQFLMNNSKKNREDKLMMDFPDLIRMIQGYLSAGIPLISSVEESIKFVGEEWQPILKNFVAEAELVNIESALINMGKEVDVFEVREFISAVSLVLKQGGDAREGFESQANKVQDMLYDAVLLKIQKRRVYSILIQMPLLLSILLILGLPAVYEVINLGL